MDTLSSLFDWILVAANTYLSHFSQRENVAVLCSNIILGASASVLFSLTFGTPRLHSTLKLWSETLTIIQWAILSYYIYLTVTYKEQTQFITVFWALSLGFVVLSAWFTRKINTDIEKLHKCEFREEECPVKDRKNCKFPKTIIDSNNCIAEFTRWQFLYMLLPNFVCAGLSGLVALFTALFFYKPN